MLRIVIREKNGQQRELQVDKNEIVIGRVPSNDLPLPKNNVSKRHAKVTNHNGFWELVDMKSTNGTYVNGQRVDGTHQLSPSDQVIIGDFLLQFEPMDAQPLAPPPVQGMGMGAPPAPNFAQPPAMPPSPPAPVGPPGGFNSPMTATAGFGATPAPAPAFPPASPPARTMTPPAMPPVPPASTMPPAPPAMPPAMPPAPPAVPNAAPEPAPAIAMPPSPPAFSPNASPFPGTRPPVPPPIGSANNPSVDARSPIVPPAPPATFDNVNAFAPASEDAPPTLPPSAPKPSVLEEAPTPMAEESVSLDDIVLESQAELDHLGEDLELLETLDGPSTNDDLPAANLDAIEEDSVIDVLDELDSIEDLDAMNDIDSIEELNVLSDEPALLEVNEAEQDVQATQDIQEESLPEFPAPEASTPAQELPSSKTPIPVGPPPGGRPPLATPPRATQTEPPKGPLKLPRSMRPLQKKEATPGLQSHVVAPASDVLSSNHRQTAEAIGQLYSQLRSEHPKLLSTPLLPDAPGRTELTNAAQNVLTQLQQEDIVSSALDAEHVVQQTVQEAVGWGPIESLLEDPEVHAIFVNSSARVFVERAGQTQSTELFFSSELALERIIQRMVSPHGIRVDRSGGAVEARLSDGTWLHAIMPPISTHGISLTLQLPKKQHLFFEQLEESQLLDSSMRTFLEHCIQHRRNILLAGDPGSGRTTLLNALAGMFGENERIISVERVRELQLEQPHWIALETRAPDTQGQGGVSMRALIEHALRIHPQRVLLGDIEGTELQTLLPRMLLGLDGVLMTARATSPEQLLYRLETLLMTASEGASQHALSHQIGAAFDIVIQLNQFACGSRKITSICELTSDAEGALILNELFTFQKEGNDEQGHVTGSFQATGAHPQFYDELHRLGVHLDTSIFDA